MTEEELNRFLTGKGGVGAPSDKVFIPSFGQPAPGVMPAMPAMQEPAPTVSSTPTIDSILNSGIGSFQPGAVNFSNPPTVGQKMSAPAVEQTMAAPANFNLDNFLGGGLSSNFGNFGDTSSPSNLFSVNAAPSNPFAIDAFADSAFNSPEVDVSLIGFQDPQGGFEQASQNQPTNFTELEGRMATPTSQPIVSSTPGAGLEPFNRYNPTTQQFEQLFGNMPAKNQFGDGEKFLESIRNEAQENASNFIGQPVTKEQLDQANRLAEEIGVTPNFQVDANGNLVTAEYGTDFKQRSPEEFNRLLNMRDIQNRQASVNTSEFQEAMDERDAPLQKSTANLKRAGELRRQNLIRQPATGDTFNYDKDGNKISAGRSAGGEEMSQSEARDIAAGESRFANEEDIARGLLVKNRVNNRLKNIELDKSANAVKNFFTANNIGKELNTGDVKMLIEATGSPQEAIKAYGNLLENLSEKQLNDFNRSVANVNAYGAGMELETPKMFKKLGDKSTRMLALSQKTGQWGYVNVDKEFIPVDINDYRETAYSEISTARKNALDLQTEIFTDVSGITQLKKFKADRIDSQEGLAQFITSIQDRFRTFFGKDISEQGMKDAIAKAGFERLLGVIRLDVLGPGVLTEQDAQRLIAAMGGFGGLADRETSVKLVERLIKSKEKAAQGRMTVYNQTRDSFKELKDELPNMTMDNVESIRRGDFLNINNSSSTNNSVEFDPDSLIK